MLRHGWTERSREKHIGKSDAWFGAAAIGANLFQGHDLYKADQSIRRKIRRDLQAVFQDSYSSVNPRMTAEQILAEPLENYERLTIAEKNGPLSSSWKE